jgi:hypothetical protein
MSDRQEVVLGEGVSWELGKRWYGGGEGLYE